MGRLFIRASIYILPLPLAVGTFLLWWRWSDNLTFSVYVLLLPVLYGYIVPGIATNLMHKWRFRGPWVIGRFYAHHGLIYASKMSPLLLLSFLGTPREPLSWPTVLRVLVCTGTLIGFAYWVNDILLVRHGMVEIDNPEGRAGRTPEEVVTRYAPLSFFTIGLTYAAAAVLAFQLFVIQHRTDPLTVGWVTTLGVVIMVLFSSLAYRATETSCQRA